MKPTVLTFVSHYVPGFRMGGPLRSIANLVDHLQGEFEFRVVTADRDMGDAFAYRGIETSRWMDVNGAAVRYLSPGEQNFAGLAKLMRETVHDVVYFNSFFSLQSTIVPLVARRLKLVERQPAVLAPRGEFSSGALSLKSGKKRAYIAAGKAAGLFTDTLWHASSDREAEDITRTLGRHARQIHTATNLSSSLGKAPPPSAPRPPGAPLRVLFLGRISPMKNIDYALRVLAMVQAPVTFSIVGPAEDAEYRSACERLGEALPDNIGVRWCSAVDPAEVPRVMAAHDLFFLPTRGENFGHVIAEALGAGTPVLLSDTTPWRGLAQAGVGDDLPLSDPAAFAAAIEAAARMTPEAEASRRARAHAYARERQVSSGDLEANRRLFLAALGR
jgi:glycosyltransferase involved in cell wall biosynthesis